MPVEDGRGRAAEPEPAARPVVLVVDDDPEVCTYLRMCLKLLAVHILEAGDGQEALAVMRHTSGLRLVITDIVMPRMDGISLKAAMQADPALHHIPVLLITGDATHQRDGPVLRKPFNARTLRAVVAPLLAP